MIARGTGDSGTRRLEAGKGPWRAVGAQLLGWTLIAAAAAYLLSNPDVLASLEGLSLPIVVGLVAATLLGLLANGLLLFGAMRIVKVRLDVVEWVGVPAANSMYNLVMPMKAGLVAKGLYLKRQHGVSVETFLAQTALASWLVAEASAGALAVSLLLRRVQGVPGEGAALGAAFALLALWTALGLGVMVIPKVPKALPGPVRGVLVRFRDGLRQLRSDAGALPVLLIGSVGVLLASAARFWVACLGLGYDVSALGVFAVQGLIGVSFVFSLTPGNLGISEGITAASAGLLGVSTEEAMLAALVDRAASVAVICVVGAAASHLLVGRALGAKSRR